MSSSAPYFWDENTGTWTKIQGRRGPIGPIGPDGPPGLDGPGMPAGVMVPFAGDIPRIPAGWLLCRGALVNRTTYAALFAAIGTRYGVGDGSTTFNLPNMVIGRVPVGADPTDPDFSWATAPTGGAKNVTLTAAQMPAHTHGITAAAGLTLGVPGGTQWADVPTGVASGATGRSAFSAASAGGGGAHTNMPPFMTVHWIIKI